MVEAPRLLTVVATIRREGREPVLLEVRTKPLPQLPTPTQIGQAVNECFGKLNLAVREELQ